jgi:hypothetical protein
LKRVSPSNALHPKLAPRPATEPSIGAATTSISSNAFWPTSAIQRSWVTGSNVNFHGLRSPIDQISPSAPSVLTNGLSAGTV